MARPRKFDRDEVLEKIMTLFWERGYAGTSVLDIVKATGLRKGSLYRSFGNKEKLFKLALSRYSVRGPAFMGDPKPSLGALLTIYGKLIADAAVPRLRSRGCFVFNSGLEFGGRPGRLGKPVMEELRKLEGFFSESVRRAVKDRELPAGTDLAAASAKAFSTAFALREMSRFRPERDFLRSVANATLAWLGTKRRV